MSEFKVGDVVECTDAASTVLAIGKTYTVLEIQEDGEDTLVCVGHDATHKDWYSFKRFKLAQPKTQLGDAAREAITIVTGERQDSYGAPEDSFGIVSEYWSTFLSARFDQSLELTPLDVTNMMVLFKQARKLGQAPKRDNYIDSIGYETIGADRLMEGGK